jgi:hypothetical protein
VLATSGDASAPAVAVARSGRAVVAWNGGTPPTVYLGPLSAAGPAAAGGAGGGLNVSAAVGSVAGRFGSAVVVSRPGALVEARPIVAESRSGEAYVAWPQTRRYVWMVSISEGGRFSAPRPLGIPAGAQLQQLGSGGNGPVVAVWLQYGVHSAPALRYARFDRDGHVSRVVTVAHLGSPLEGVAVSVNDAGAIAAGWVNTGAPVDGKPQVRAELCSPAGRCSPRQTIHFSLPLGQSDAVSTTLSGGGIATVLVSGFTVGTGMFSAQQFGLQAAISRSGAPFRTVPTVAPSAENQVATAAGARGALVAFPLSGTTLAASQLDPTAGSFSTPRILDRRMVNGPVAAASSTGAEILAWNDAPPGEITASSYSIQAALGTSSRLAAPQRVVPGSDHIASATLATGIDGHGHALIAWNRWGNSGPQGVFLSVGTP